MKKIVILLTFSLIFSWVALGFCIDKDQRIEDMVDYRVWGNFPGYNYPGGAYGPYYNYGCYPPYPYYPYGGGSWAVFTPKTSTSPYPATVKAAGRVMIHVDPVDAEVYLDGLKLQQMQDLSYQIVLLSGNHTLLVKKDGYKEQSHNIEVPAGGGIIVPVELEKNK
jgi:hypothetical protein